MVALAAFVLCSWNIVSSLGWMDVGGRVVVMVALAALVLCSWSIVSSLGWMDDGGSNGSTGSFSIVLMEHCVITWLDG